MEFSPFNPIVKRCLQGMALSEQGHTEAALQVFHKGWAEATEDFEKFLTAHYIAQLQTLNAEKLNWLKKALEFTEKINDDSVKSALPALHTNIATCYELSGDHLKAHEHVTLSKFFQEHPSDKGPFYHGTKSELQVGDFLNAGGTSNYRADLKMNHIYFTALLTGAGLAAALAKGTGTERVYVIEPTGAFENDPNVTDKKFPGNPTRSYRSESPLKIIAEVHTWQKQSPEEIQKFRERLSNNGGEIIN